MAGNTFGELFKITTFGESHGAALGVIIDGVPSQIEISEEMIQQELNRRRPGQSKITTSRQEADKASILSGVFEGKTTGTPIAVIIANGDQRSQDYSHLKNSYRPSHADFTYQAKYGHRDYRGGGRASARETAARVAAGAIAKKYLSLSGIQIVAYVSQVGKIKISDTFKIPKTLEQLRKQTESQLVRCPDVKAASKMQAQIEKIKAEGDTLGGIVSCVIRGVPAGLGEPVFDKLSAQLAKAIVSIQAVKGFEYGSGFAGVELKGSSHNDIFVSTKEDGKKNSGKSGGKIQTLTNHSGGIQGGISNGMDIDFRVAFKPVATVIKTQPSVDSQGQAIELQGKGRHDPCVVPRAVPIVEAMAALVIADMMLLHRAVSKAMMP